LRPRVRGWLWPTVACLCAGAASAGVSGGRPAGGGDEAPPDVLATLLADASERLGPVLRHPARHRVQIIYTQIDRDASNAPRFRSYRYRVDPDEYFYPASTVKLPTAIVALEKLNRLAIEGLDRDTPMFTGAASPAQSAVERDPLAPGGVPTVGQYVRRIALVSDNDAFNRLYEFVGQDALNATLRDKGLEGVRIIHRLELALDLRQNRHTNPVVFRRGEQVLYRQPAIISTGDWIGDGPILLGRAEVIAGELRQAPKDFAVKNALPLQALHDVVQELMFPGSVGGRMRFALTPADYRLLYTSLSAYPRESGIPAFADPERYPDGYVKFLMFGGDAARIPPGIRVFNKVGDAYGFLTDAAYVVDFDHGVEFLLAATVYTNANQTFNDNDYEYDTIGFPFLAALGQEVYAFERTRVRPHAPDLERFRVH
jgi:hypothetical protein